MSIPNYTTPRLTILQRLQRTTGSADSNRYALVIGPQYHIVRQLVTDGLAYNTAGLALPIANFESDWVPDETYTKVYASGLHLRVSNDAELTSNISDISAPHIVKLKSATVSFAGTGLGRTPAASLRGRPVKVGDVVNTPAGDLTVTGLLGADTAAAVGAAAAASSNPLAAGSTTTVVVAKPSTVSAVASTFTDTAAGPVYNGYLGDRITLTVVVGGIGGVATYKVRSASGKYSLDNVASTGNATSHVVDFGGGVVTLTTSASLISGATIVFDVRGAYTSVVPTAAGAYTGAAATSYLLTVVTGGASGTAQVRITDTAGYDVTSVVTVTNASAFAVGSYGATASFTFGGNVLHVGDVYTIAATPAGYSTTVFDKLVLSGPALPVSSATTATDIALDVRAVYNGEISAKAAADTTLNFTTSAAGSVNVRANLAVYDASRAPSYQWLPAVTGTGKIYTTTRCLVPPALGESYFEVNASSTEIGSMTELDNPIGYSAGKVLSSNAPRVFVLRVAADTAEAYAAALKTVEATDSFRYIACCSTKLEVAAVVKAHVENMSSYEVMNWRRVYVGIESPGVYKSLSGTATITAGTGGNTRLIRALGGFATANIYAGDTIRCNYSIDSWGAPTFEEYVIESVVSDTELKLKTGPVVPVATAAAFELWKADTARATADYVIAAANSLNSRRVCLVWADKPELLTDSGYVHVSNTYGAAEVAGLRAAAPVNQGLTTVEVSYASRAPGMYGRFSRLLLDEIAAAGVYVITQDAVGGALYIRHQLTTKTDAGVLSYEDSVGDNWDDVCYNRVKAVLRKGWIGVTNVTPQGAALLNNRLSAALLLATNTTDELLGPQILGFSDGEGNQARVKVTIDPVLKDRYKIFFDSQLPTPTNGIAVEAFGTTINL